MPFKEEFTILGNLRCLPGQVGLSAVVPLAEQHRRALQELPGPFYVKEAPSSQGCPSKQKKINLCTWQKTRKESSHISSNSQSFATELGSLFRGTFVMMTRALADMQIRSCM